MVGTVSLHIRKHSAPAYKRWHLFSKLKIKFFHFLYKLLGTKQMNNKGVTTKIDELGFCVFGCTTSKCFFIGTLSVVTP